MTKTGNQKSITYILTLLLILFIPIIYFKTYLGPIPVSIEIILIPLLVLAFIYEYFKGKISLNENPFWLYAIPFGLYALVSVASMINAVNLTAAIMETARFLSYAILFLIILKVKFTKTQFINFGKIFLLSLSFVAIFGIVQYVLGFSLNQNGMYAIPEAKGRVDSTFINPNYYAAFINLILPGLLIFAVIYFKDKKSQLLMFLLYALFVINIILTYTRASWVIMAGGFFLIFVFLFKKMVKNFFKWHILVSMLILAVVAYNLPSVDSRTESAFLALAGVVGIDIKTSEPLPEEEPEVLEEEDEQEKIKEKQLREVTDKAVVSRGVLWKTGLIMYMENPILGVGIGNYLDRYNDVVDEHPELDLGHEEGYSVHNSFIKVMAETGTLGILTFLSIYVVLFVQLLKHYFRNKKHQLLTVSLGIGAITFMMQNMTNNLIFIPQTNIMFWLIGAVVLNYIQSQSKTNETI